MSKPLTIDNLIEAVNDLYRLLEARGLKHPKHAVHIGPARARIKAVMAHYFGRQRAAVLKAIKPRIARELAAHPIALKEADDGDWVTIHGHPVLIGGGAEAVSERVERAKAAKDVASCALAMRDLAKDQEMLIITNGCN